MLDTARKEAAGITFTAESHAAQKMTMVAEATKKVDSGDFIEALQVMSMMIYNCDNKIVHPSMKGALLDKINALLNPRNIYGKVGSAGKLYYEHLGGVKE
jgi:hypothetical protein